MSGVAFEPGAAFCRTCLLLLPEALLNPRSSCTCLFSTSLGLALDGFKAGWTRHSFREPVRPLFMLGETDLSITSSTLKESQRWCTHNAQSLVLPLLTQASLRTPWLPPETCPEVLPHCSAPAPFFLWKTCRAVKHAAVKL